MWYLIDDFIVLHLVLQDLYVQLPKKTTRTYLAEQRSGIVSITTDHYNSRVKLLEKDKVLIVHAHLHLVQIRHLNQQKMRS